ELRESRLAPPAAGHDRRRAVRRRRSRGAGTQSAGDLARRGADVAPRASNLMQGNKVMSDRSYYAPHGGHPAQTELMTGRAVFTEAYAVIPKGVMRDIVTSCLPHWEETRAWIIARPMSGFAETFSQYIMEVG